MRLIVTLSFAAACVTAAAAQGLASRNLSKLGPAAVATLGKGFEVRAEPERMTLLCTSCAGAPMVDVTIGRQADGTEERVRSGRTKIADLQRLCQARSPACTVSALDVVPAVGWVSSYPMMGKAGATAVILRGGDLLTLRALADDAITARSMVDRLLPLAHARIIGSAR